MAGKNPHADTLLARFRSREATVGVIGLGYVGLPLAVAFGAAGPTLGYDRDERKIKRLRERRDVTGEVSAAEFSSAKELEISSDPRKLREADFLIIAVPTPIDAAHRPDLGMLLGATETAGRHMKRGATVVFESTVYPGCTEEVCIPIVERESGFTAGVGFNVGYSPERVNPGDAEHTLETVKKIVAAQDPEIAELLARVYGLVVQAGIHKAPSIRIAEAAKVIENVQRDLNIALMNELAVLFHRMGLDTVEVFQAARTKWNFLPFEPGLVGGHCIPVDPYYLTHKAQELDYHPEIILTGRRINDFMGIYVAQQTVKLLIQAGKVVRGAKALVLGAAFKPDVCDVRNTRVAELIVELEKNGLDIAVHDPLVHTDELRRFNVRVISNPFKGKEKYDAVILAVPHRIFQDQPAEAYTSLLKNGCRPSVLVDVKGVMPQMKCQKGVQYWRL